MALTAIDVEDVAGALSHQPFLLVSTYPLAQVVFNKVNGLANQSRKVRGPLLARRDNAFWSLGHSLFCRWRTNFNMALSASSQASRRVAYDCGERR